MLIWVEAHPLVTGIICVFLAAILGVIGYFLKKLIEPSASSKNQSIKNSNVGGDVQQAEVILNHPSFNSYTEDKVEAGKIKLAPSLGAIPPVMNGGIFQGDFACFQIRFGSETDLELIGASIMHGAQKIDCQSRDSKLLGGKNWNSFHFSSAELPFIPDEIFSIIIKVSDHDDHCSELIHQLQMKQFPHPEYVGVISGRWEIHPIGIFKIKSCKAAAIVKSYDEIVSWINKSRHISPEKIASLSNASIEDVMRVISGMQEEGKIRPIKSDNRGVIIWIKQ
ncbi:MAG: hypothetical protein PHE68_00670 [Candidatus Peribacteraceae bacterium]|nr:hypothetical protein [Candidatus Peribacteraceae bacterium]MDD5075165.1 hypothetical protein [Candidatus Peribacteraceae bacterium]